MWLFDCLIFESLVPMRRMECRTSEGGAKRSREWPTLAKEFLPVGLFVEFYQLHACVFPGHRTYALKRRSVKFRTHWDFLRDFSFSGWKRFCTIKRLYYVHGPNKELTSHLANNCVHTAWLKITTFQINFTKCPKIIQWRKLRSMSIQLILKMI